MQPTANMRGFYVQDLDGFKVVCARRLIGGVRLLSLPKYSCPKQHLSLSIKS
jgi:hypothetical protein